MKVKVKGNNKGKISHCQAEAMLPIWGDKMGERERDNRVTTRLGKTSDRRQERQQHKKARDRDPERMSVTRRNWFRVPPPDAQGNNKS